MKKKHRGTMRVRIACLAPHTEDIKVAWRHWSAIPVRGDHVSLKQDGIIGTVVSIMYTDTHVAVVVKP